MRSFSLLLCSALVGASPFAVGEDEAIALVTKAMRRVSPEEQSQCLSYDVEEQSRQWLDVAVREKHGGECPGDPTVAPVVERFRVARSPLALGRWDPVNDAYVECEVSANGDLACPHLSFK